MCFNVYCDRRHGSNTIRCHFKISIPKQFSTSKMFHDSANAKFQSFPVRREYFVDENLIAREDHRLFIIKTKLKNQVTIQRLFWFRLVQRFIIAQ